MDKKILFIAALCTVSTTLALDTWYGYTESIKTGLDNGLETSGYWYTYNDNKEGGQSKIILPTQTQAYEGTDYVPSDAILNCGGVCGDAVLTKGSLTYHPFVGVAFNVVGESSATDPTPAVGDASSWGGICITYKSDAAPSLELGFSEDVDKAIGGANPSAALPKSTVPTKKILAWSNFKQPSWYKGETKISGIEAAKQLASVRFKIQAQEGTYNFRIERIDTYNNCTTDDIKTIRESPATRVLLSGRTLEFAGVSTATAEVFNLQGQVVAKGSIDNTTSALNLATLDAGIYMIHVAGKAVNFTQKIILK